MKLEDHVDVSAVLAETGHRPFPLPDSAWLQIQVWNDLLFAHWRLDPETVRAMVPPELELDLHDGAAWIGMTPFLMSGVRARGLPPIPGLSRFPELNLRTYVRCDGLPGIYFFSLDATNIPAIAGARAVYAFPYFFAGMTHERWGDGVRYTCRREDVERANAAYHGNRVFDPARWTGTGELRARYWPVGELFEAEPPTLEHFLAERYCAYSVLRGRVYRTHIHHLPWPLQRAEAQFDTNTMPQADGIDLPATPGHLMFARRLEVLVWTPERVR